MTRARRIVSLVLLAAIPAASTALGGTLRRDAKPDPRAAEKDRQARTPQVETARLVGQAAAPRGSLVLWYRQPAKMWEPEALPIGNGHVGGMVFGGVSTERIQLNEHSLWTGSDRDSDTGAYQPLGDLLVELGHGEAQDYRRELDISRALHRVTYTSGGTAYCRECFCSHPARVMVLRLTAGKAGVHSGVVRLVDAHDARSIAEKDKITAAGTLANGLEYESQVQVLHEGGTLRADHGSLRFDGARTLTILLAAGTSYVNDCRQGWLGRVRTPGWRKSWLPRPRSPTTC